MGQTVRSTPLAIYRISPTTSAETFVAIGISIALEKLFAHKIPKVILVRQEQNLPFLLRGYKVVGAIGTKEVTQKLRASLPKIIGVVKETSWQPRPLPFIEILETTQSPSKSGLALEVLLESVTKKAQKLTDADRLVSLFFRH